MKLLLVKKHHSRRLIGRAMYFPQVKSDRTGNYVILGVKTGKPLFFKMSERFVDAGSVDSFIAEQENKATLQKTQRDVKLLQTFLETKNELRRVEKIPAVELNEYMCEFIISDSTKDGKDYEPSSLRSLLASRFERHLKKNNYSAGIMNDLVFEKTRKVLLSKQKELKKKGKGNKPNASVAVTSDELNTFYEKGLLGTQCGG